MASDQYKNLSMLDLLHRLDIVAYQVGKGEAEGINVTDLAAERYAIYNEITKRINRLNENLFAMQELFTASL